MLSNDNWLLLSILFFVGMMAWAVRYAIDKKSGLLDPIFVFLGIFSLFVLPLPCNCYFSPQTVIVGVVTNELPRVLPYMPLTVFLCALGVLFFVLGYYSRFARRLGGRIPAPPNSAKHPLIAFLFLAVISCFLIAQLVRDSGGILSFLLLGYNVTTEMYGKGYLVIGFSWFFVATLFLLYSYAMSRKRGYLVMFLIALPVIVGMQILMARRAEIAVMIMTVTFFWHYAVRPISFGKLLLCGLILLLGLNAVGFIRTSNYESLSDFWSRSGSRFFQTAGRGDVAVYTLTQGEFVIPFQTMPNIIRRLGSDITPKYGMTYLRAPMYAVPSAIYPDRPPTLGHWYMQQFYGRGFEINVGVAFFFLSEGYLNFGPIGPLIVMLFWGVLCGALQQYRASAGREPGVALLCALAAAFVLEAIPGDSSTLVVGFPSSYLAPALLGLWLATRGAQKRAYRRGLPARVGAGQALA